jgi:murein hydrolase activator
MKLLFVLFILCMTLSNSGSATSTKTKLNQLEAHVLNIKKQLSVDESSRDKHYQTLSLTEKKISQDLHTLHRLTTEEKEIKKTIQSITTRMNTLNQQRSTQEKMLARHIRARHQLGVIHPWQWLLHQESPRTLSRLFVFYHYLFQADQRLIQQLRETSTHLESQQVALALQQKKLIPLQTQLTQRHKRLKSMKQKQEALIHTLNQTIETKHVRLKTLHNDKARLQSLVKKLSAHPQSSKKSMPSSTVKLGSERLKSPLKNPSQQTKLLNQGLVFLASEGTPVLSILPGKVIFSDWLKGYGLLLIIDHGHGVMSLYAHNASLFKPLGSSVKQGEQIATVGHTGGLRENGLYFEVRRGGRAVPPREWMS